jgi:integrase
MSTRKKTDYPGVFFREVSRALGKGSERVYYVVYKKAGRFYEEKAGKQYQDNMSPAKAARIRGELMEGKRLSRKKKREREKAANKAELDKWTINRLWESYVKTREPGPGFVADKARYHKHIKKPFGSKAPSEIKPLEVERLRINLSKTLAPQTVKHVLNLLTWITNYGAKNQLCEGLTFYVKKPVVNNVKTEYLTPDQMNNLLDTIENQPNYQVGNLMKVALFTGMRKGELLNLLWKDLDFERGFITIRDPKGVKDQIIPMNDAAREVLETHPRESRKYIFPGRDGGKRVTIDAAARKIKKKAGLPKDFRAIHGLRHHFASMLASSGKVDMYTLQKLLTHKSPLMTQRYAHLRDETLKQASQLMNDLVTDVRNSKAKLVEINQ